MPASRRFEQEEVDQAAREAAGIGGATPDEGLDPAERPVAEGGGGESEGFELAQQELIEHATHSDQQAAHVILHHQGLPEELDATGDGASGDHEPSSELDADER
jgi:hypothetical protein